MKITETTKISRTKLWLKLIKQVNYACFISVLSSNARNFCYLFVRIVSTSEFMTGSSIRTSKHRQDKADLVKQISFDESEHYDHHSLALPYSDNIALLLVLVKRRVCYIVRGLDIFS